MMHDVVIIGAGVSGLATAHDLVRMGYDVKVLERQVTIGGNARSKKLDGYLMDLGPTTINAAFPEVNERVAGLGLAQSAVDLGPGVKRRYLCDERGLNGISVNPLGFFLSNYLSPKARLSMLLESFRNTKTDNEEETIHGFVSRRFGREFADKVIDPMAAGIFMGDAKTLSIAAAFPKLIELEKRFGSVTRGVLAAKRGSEPGRRLYSWRDGIGVLPQKLASLLNGRIQTGVAVTGITQSASGFDIATANSGSLSARTVLLAVQPHVASALLEKLDPDCATATADIAAPPVAVVFLGYHKSQIAHPLDGLGFLSVKTQGRIISGVQFNSTMFPGRAPKGHVALSAYVGGARNPRAAILPEKDLIATVETEIADLLGLSGTARLASVHRWPRGLPQYSLGHRDRREVIVNSNKRVPGLFLIGNYINGVSIASCLSFAGEMAKEVSQMLNQGQSGFSSGEEGKRTGTAGI